MDERSESDETGLSDGFLLAVLRDAGRPGGAVGAALISLQNDEARYNHEVLARKINIGVATALETTVCLTRISSFVKSILVTSRRPLSSFHLHLGEIDVDGSSHACLNPTFG